MIKPWYLLLGIAIHVRSNWFDAFASFYDLGPYDLDPCSTPEEKKSGFLSVYMFVWLQYIYV